MNSTLGQVIKVNVCKLCNSQTGEDHIYGISPVVEYLVHHLEEQVFSEVIHHHIVISPINLHAHNTSHSYAVYCTL